MLLFVLIQFVAFLSGISRLFCFLFFFLTLLPNVVHMKTSEDKLESDNAVCS